MQAYALVAVTMWAVETPQNTLTHPTSSQTKGMKLEPAM